MQGYPTDAATWLNPESWETSEVKPRPRVEGGTTWEVLLKPRRPLRPIEPHSIDRCSVILRRGDLSVLAVRGFDAQGRAAYTTTFSAFTTVADRPVAMVSQTVVPAGQVAGTVRLQSTSGGPEGLEEVHGKLDWPAAMIDRRYQVLPEGTVVPRTVRCLDEEGSVFLELEFSCYAVNMGLRDEEFPE